MAGVTAARVSRWSLNIISVSVGSPRHMPEVLGLRA